MTRGHRPVAREFVQECALRGDVDECIPWPFQKNRDGYGVLWSPRPNRVPVRAHRAVLDAAGVVQPEWATEVRHLCGHRDCVNPQHLKWGTKSENQKDRFELHGDHSRGERNNRAVLTESDVIAIRASSKTTKDLATEYGVCLATIGMVRTRRTWTHL